MSDDSIDPARNFTITTEERVRAMTIGAPAWSTRKKDLEDKEAALLKALLGVYDKEGMETVRRHARTVNLDKLNAIIVKHNRWYPIEANLPIDMKTHGYLQGGNPWRPQPLWTHELLLEAFDAALAAR